MSNVVDQETVDSRIDARDRDGRLRAVDPRYNVALEASAGTGKTRVLVDRYVNLLRAGVDPAHILAMTFTRKAAAEMRERIIATLRDAATRGELAPARWRELRDRTDDIAVSTIDAFCLSLLREFPLEADLDPGFDVADETEVPRLIDESLDRALRTCRSLAREDEHIALVFAQLGDRRARRGLAALLNRRLVAPAVLSQYLQRCPSDLTVTVTTRRATDALVGVFTSMSRGLDGFLETGPPEPLFLLLARDLRKLEASLATGTLLNPAIVQATYSRAREYFLTDEGEPRKRILFTKAQFVSERAWAIHRDLVVNHAAAIKDAFDRYRRDLNVLVSRGVLRMYRIAEAEYRRTLDAHAVLDFADLLQRTLDLLRQMDEFAQSRYRLESRYHHVLVDEFQDTSRAQWELVSLLVQSWGEGAGLASSGPLPPSIFIVGDRKQSIYAFRDADVSILDDARRYIEALRPEGDARRTISRSFRSVPALLAFVNDVARDVPKVDHRRDAFRYAEEDQFPVDGNPGESPLGLITGESPEACAEATAAEIARLLESETVVRDKTTGVARRMTPSDVAILFRSRDSHREFEAALERRGIGAYVYKGLGFFDADEIKDVLALLWYLADPLSDMRAAALLRSRFARISDETLRRLAPHVAAALGASPPAVELDAKDTATLSRLRDACARWRHLVDHLPPAELLDLVLSDSAYFVETRGPRLLQARENLKKIRALIRRIQNRGYATLGRIAAHLDRLAVGDESNAVIDALDAVNLMTVHAAKGLEFPVVFVVNLARGTGGFRDPIRVVAGAGDADVSVAVGDFRSRADEDAAAREAEESKRLLYVALTRARDRLYLGSVSKDGSLQPGRGSLAAVLPPTLITQFGASGEVVEWRASSGSVHQFHVVREPGSGVSRAESREIRDPLVPGSRDSNPESRIPNPGVEPLIDLAPARLSVASVVSTETERGRSERTPATSSRFVGTLVHRLLQRIGVGDPGGGIRDAQAIRDIAMRLVRRDEVDDLGDLQHVVDAAVAAYESLCAREDVRVLYQAGRALHEVPFTMSIDGRIVRGSFDCVVETAPGAFTLLEFKTGRERLEDRRQVELYLQALRYLFPGASIEARVVYAGGGSVLLV